MLNGSYIDPAAVNDNLGLIRDKWTNSMKTIRILVSLAFLAAVTFALTAKALTQEELQATLEARFKGDRTGACVVAAFIEKDQVIRAKTCAQPRGDVGPGFDGLFEIGSVTKTMTAFLVADLIGQGKWSLDDPIAKHLPPGTSVPSQGERQILVRDVLTHTSGLPALPPDFKPRNVNDPYADLSEAKMLAGLGTSRLSGSIGSHLLYSNFAMMVMSSAVARAFEGDFEEALVKRLFTPLKMDGAFVERPRSQRPVVVGHKSSGQVTSDWHITNNLAGVGMVRATLDDMVKYAQAHLGQADAALLAPILLTQKPLRESLGMNWGLTKVQGHDLVGHEGATGGFSSLLMLEPKTQRAAIILSDTSLANLGSLGMVGRAILGIDGPPLRPRLTASPSEALLNAIVGDYQLGAMNLHFWLDGKRLLGRATGQSAFELKYDSLGDFYPESFDALMTPKFENGRVDRASWRQGGGLLEMTRRGAP